MNDLEKLKSLCEKFTQDTVAKSLGYSRVQINNVVNKKQKMSRLLSYLVRDIDESNIEYTTVLRSSINYLDKDKDRIEEFFYKLEQDIKRYFTAK